MKAKWTTPLVSSVLCAAGSAPALAQPAKYIDDSTFRIARSPDWDIGATSGVCRIRVWVDDRARVQFRGDQVIVRTETGRKSRDEGSVCNQPLPFHRVEDFRVVAERGRGAVFEVDKPDRRNNFTGALTIDDPQDGGEEYEVVVAWRNPEGRVVAPLASADPYPWFDETRACQDRVRSDFLARNDDGDAYLEFTSIPLRDEMGERRDRIRGEAWARNRNESRPITYECVVNERTNRVVSARYEVVPRGRFSSLY